MTTPTTLDLVDAATLTARITTVVQLIAQRRPHLDGDRASTADQLSEQLQFAAQALDPLLSAKRIPVSEGNRPVQSLDGCSL